MNTTDNPRWKLSWALPCRLPTEGPEYFPVWRDAVTVLRQRVAETVGFDDEVGYALDCLDEALLSGDEIPFSVAAGYYIYTIAKED